MLVGGLLSETIWLILFVVRCSVVKRTNAERCWSRGTNIHRLYVRLKERGRLEPQLYQASVWQCTPSVSAVFFQNVPSVIVFRSVHLCQCFKLVVRIVHFT